jgi:hypothetical protein
LTRLAGNSPRPGRTPLRYWRIGIRWRRHVSTTKEHTKETDINKPNYSAKILRAMQLENQFDKIADEIELAKTKRRYMLLMALRHKRGEPRQERRGHLVPLLRILQNLKSRQAFETQSFRSQSAASARTSGRSLKELLRSARSSFRRGCIGRQLQSWRRSSLQKNFSAKGSMAGVAFS